MSLKPGYWHTSQEKGKIGSCCDFTGNFKSQTCQSGVRGFHTTTFTRIKPINTAHSASSLPHAHTHAHAWWNISIAFTHPYIQVAIPPKKRSSNHTCKHWPSHTLRGLPQLAERGHALGHAPGFLHLAVSIIYSLSAPRWEVHCGRSGQLPRDRIHLQSFTLFCMITVP